MTCRVEGHGGVRIAVTDRGGDGAPVLFVHGFAHHGRVWDDVVGDLPVGHRTLCMDLRGHGRSDWSVSGAYSLDDYASDIPLVLDGLGLERAAIVAHSLGGNAATLAAAAHPSRVSGLVLVDTGPSLSLAGMTQVASGVSETLRSHPGLAEYRSTLDIAYPLADPAGLDRLASAGVAHRPDGRVEPRLDPAVLSNDVDTQTIAALEVRLWDALGRVEAPTLVVRGAASAMLPRETAEKMIETLPGHARLETLERAGHSVMLDRAAALAERIVDFLAAPQRNTASRWDSTAASQSARLSSCG